MERQSINKFVQRLSALFAALFLPLYSIAQQGYAKETEMADVLYQNGRIYLVVFVMAIIFAGIILYLVRIEKKLNKLEKNS